MFKVKENVFLRDPTAESVNSSFSEYCQEEWERFQRLKEKRFIFFWKRIILEYSFWILEKFLMSLNSREDIFLREKPEGVSFREFYQKEEERLLSLKVSGKFSSFEEEILDFSIWLVKETLLKVPVDKTSVLQRQVHREITLLNNLTGEEKSLFGTCIEYIGSSSFHIYYVKQKEAILQELSKREELSPKERILFPYILSVCRIFISIPIFTSTD